MFSIIDAGAVITEVKASAKAFEDKAQKSTAFSFGKPNIIFRKTPSSMSSSRCSWRRIS